MSEPPSSNPSPSSRKRSLPEDDSSVPFTPVKGSQASTSSSDALSTPRSVISLDQSPLAFRDPGSQQNLPPTCSNGPLSGEDHGSPQGTPNAGPAPTKRRKLTVQDKEEKRKEREEKERQRAEQKAKREEDKRAKDEERQRKNEKKEERQRQKDFEKQQKEEALRKKERSQLRLGSFFKIPAPTRPPEDDAQELEPSATVASRRDSVGSREDGSFPRSPIKAMSPRKRALLEYQQFFLPFELPSNTICAPINAFIQNEEEIQAKRRELDGYGDAWERKQLPSRPAPDARTFVLEYHTWQEQLVSRGYSTRLVRELMERFHGTTGHPIDLTGDGVPDPSQSAMDELMSIPMKYLHFSEDVRPPYYGTYTKVQSRLEGRRLARNPFSRTLPEANYDYDSEAEWEEPEEGEDLDSEDEDEPDSIDGEEDMEGFLDDEDAADAAKLRRGLIAGNLEPVCSGLHWEDEQGISRPAHPSAASYDLRDFKMGALLEPPPKTIDPFSTFYWMPAPAAPPPTSTFASKAPTEASLNGSADPSRVPLLERSEGGLNGTKPQRGRPSKAGSNGDPAAPKPPKRLVPAEHMEEFKLAVRGSDLTKLALIESLKKRFPKVPKDAINNTLISIAARVGAKEAEKRWVIVLDT